MANSRGHRLGVTLTVLGATTIAAGLGSLLGPAVAAIAAGFVMITAGLAVDWE